MVIAKLKTVLVVAADRREFAGFIRHVPQPVRLQWPVDYSASVVWNDCRWVLLANGAGPRLAGEAADVARAQVTIDAVVSFGFCGGLDPSLEPGSVVVASAVEAPDRGERYAAESVETARPVRNGLVVSVDRVLGTAAEKAELRNRGGDVVEMEAAGLADRACSWKIPFYCVRAVTDTAKESFYLDLNAARDPAGRISRWKIVKSALRRPVKGAPELLRLRRRSQQAAARLGEFFADCKF
jgi:adenosylhomocysteine nucleosidase